MISRLRRLWAWLGELRPIYPGRFQRMTPARQAAAVRRLEQRRRRLRTEQMRIIATLRTMSQRDPNSEQLYRRALRHLTPADMTHLDLVSIGRHWREPILQADSLWASLVGQRRKRQLGKVPHQHLGLSKESDMRLAELVGIRTPRAIYTGPFGSIPTDIDVPVVVKPTSASGAKGAFYVFAPDDIFAIHNSLQLDSWEACIAEAARQLKGGVEAMDWEVQELITDAGRPAPDLKFYAFYGQVGLIQEVSRYPTKLYEFFDPDGTVADAGYPHYPRFPDPAMATTPHGGVTDDMLATVRRLSAAIPTPFLRLDFLKADDELVLVEICSAPGMSHTMTRRYDRKLGAMYHDAEVRLVNDLLGGKRFETFETFVTGRQLARR